MLEGYSLLSLSPLAIAAIAQYQLVSYRRSRMRMPPGPVGYPIIGNLFDMPKGYDPPLWAKYRDKYGIVFIPAAFKELTQV